MSQAVKQDIRRVGNASLIPGYKHLVRDSEYLGGVVAFVERRLSVGQNL